MDGVCHSAIDSILKNYTALISTLQVVKEGHDEYAAKGKGLLIVQSFYGLTFNKLQQKCFQQFLVQKNVLYNILKVSQNPMGGSVKNWQKYS